MQLLLIDNGSKHLGQLEAVCAKYTLTVLPLEQLTGYDISLFDAVILSGSYEHSVLGDHKLLQPELDLITSSDKPILGICLGFELVCYAYGAQLDRLAERAEGATVITPTDEGARIFQGTDPIRVTEAHRWHVEAEDLPKILAILATSETGVEAVRHKSKPIYGLQFHPEDFTYASDGKLVLENILSTFAKLSKPTASRAS